jgi:hypothetical protein
MYYDLDDIFWGSVYLSLMVTLGPTISGIQCVIITMEFCHKTMGIVQLVAILKHSSYKKYRDKNLIQINANFLP